MGRGCAEEAERVEPIGCLTPEWARVISKGFYLGKRLSRTLMARL